MTDKRSPQSDLNKEIEGMLSNKKLCAFVRWFCDGQDESKWDSLSKNYLNNIDMEKALKLHLEKKDVQEAIIYVTKFQKDLNLVKLYNSMMKKALSGDVNSANWVTKFSESEFFNSKADEFTELKKSLNLGTEE